MQHKVLVFIDTRKIKNISLQNKYLSARSLLESLYDNINLHLYNKNIKKM